MIKSDIGLILSLEKSKRHLGDHDLEFKHLNKDLWIKGNPVSYLKSGTKVIRTLYSESRFKVLEIINS